MIELVETTFILAPIHRVFDLARSIDVHRIGSSKTRERATGGVTSGLIGMGQSVTWQAVHFGIRQSLTSKITAYDEPIYFQDTMQHGAFRSLQHDHLFRSPSSECTEMRDKLSFSAPFLVLGRIVEHLVLRNYMLRFLRQRNAILKRIAESTEWQRYLSAGL